MWTALNRIGFCFFSCSFRRRSAGRRQRLADSGPLSFGVRKRTIVEMPPDIHPFPVAAQENFRATPTIYHGFTLEPRLENIGVVKNRRIAEYLNLRPREFQSEELHALFIHCLRQSDQTSAIIPLIAV